MRDKDGRGHEACFNNIIEFISEQLGPNYRNIKLHKKGGTRLAFLADWGPGDEKRIIKFDIPPATPRGERHVGRGYDTAHDIGILGRIPEPEEHNIIRMIDFKQAENCNLSVESYFPSNTLEEMVEDKGPLDIQDFEKVFSKVLDADSYLINRCSLYHRDIKPSNILVRRNGDISVRLTDLANAGEIGNLSDRIVPTAGGHFVRDPLITPSIFPGLENARYDDQSEMYEIASSMFYALTGKHHVDIDPDTSEAKSDFIEGSLFDEHKHLIAEKYEKTLENALDSLEGPAKKYKNILRKNLTLDASERYASINEFERDFKKISTRSKRMKKGVLTAAALATIVGLSTIPFIANNNKQEAPKRPQVEVNADYPVTAQITRQNNYVENNMTKMDFQYINKNRSAFDIFDTSDSKLTIPASPGDDGIMLVRLDEKPIPEYLRQLLGRKFEGIAYFEGFEGTNFNINSEPINYRIVDNWQLRHGVGTQTVGFDVPADMKPGVYMMNVDIFAPESSEDIAYNMPGGVLQRKRVPVVVGDIVPEKAVYLQDARFSGTHLGLNFHTIDKDLPEIDQSLQYDIRLVEEDYEVTVKKQDNASSSQFYKEIELPEGDNTDIRTLETVIRDGKDIVGVFYTPVARQGKYKDWDLAVPDKDYATRVAEYRKDVK